MSQKLPNMLENTIQKIREMVDVNSVIGEPINTPDGVTIIPVSKVKVGFAGGGFGRGCLVGSGGAALGLVADGADGNAFAFAGTGVGFGPLSADRQVAAVTDAAVAVDLLETAHILRQLTAEIAFHYKVVLQHHRDRRDIFVRDLIGFRSGFDFRAFDQFFGDFRPDSINVPESKFDPLVPRNVNTDNSRHVYSSPFQPCFCL